MQTFLPYEDFTQSAKCLDYRRLGKQRVECKQILNVLLGHPSRWYNHPAVLMWKGHEYQLCKYAIEICKEWRARGYNDSLLPFFIEHIKMFSNKRKPKWLGGYKFHSSHRSNLLRKKAEHYNQFGWRETDELPYIWPVRKND